MDNQEFNLSINDSYFPSQGNVMGVDTYGKLRENIPLPLWKINTDGTLEQINIREDSNR